MRAHFAAMRYVASWHIAAPDECDGTSAVGESRHRILGASVGQPTEPCLAEGSVELPGNAGLVAGEAHEMEMLNDEVANFREQRRPDRFYPGTTTLKPLHPIIIEGVPSMVQASGHYE